MKESPYLPVNGTIKDEKTAIKIAKAIWIPIHGKEIKDLRPFEVTYAPVLDYWIVRGNVAKCTTENIPEIIIKKRDGQVMYVK